MRENSTERRARGSTAAADNDEPVQLNESNYQFSLVLVLFSAPSTKPPVLSQRMCYQVDEYSLSGKWDVEVRGPLCTAVGRGLSAV